MAPRAYWTGHLRLSLVNIPVKLYPATTSERRIELHQIHAAERQAYPLPEDRAGCRSGRGRGHHQGL